VTVGEPIDQDKKWWNKDLIESIFMKEEALILSKLLDKLFPIERCTNLEGQHHKRLFDMFVLHII
jgi:hypothetical protein